MCGVRNHRGHLRLIVDELQSREVIWITSVMSIAGSSDSPCSDEVWSDNIEIHRAASKCSTHYVAKAYGEPKGGRERHGDQWNFWSSDVSLDNLEKVKDFLQPMGIS